MTEKRAEYIIAPQDDDPEPEGFYFSDLEQIRDHYSQIPNMIVDILRLSEIGFYLYVKRTAWEHGKCYKTVRTMAEELGVDEKTITKLKKSLLDKGLIHIQERRDGKTLHHFIEIVDLWQKNHEYYYKGEK